MAYPNYQAGAEYGGVGDLLGAGLVGYGMSQYQNPADTAMPYMNQIPGELQQYFNPYIQAGNNALPVLQGQYGSLLGQLPGLQSQYGMLMNNPGAVMNKIGQGFQQSPGYQFQVNQALGAANRAAAAGGMLGSPMEQQTIAGRVNGLANQDYYNYLNHGLSLYNTGLQGSANLYGAGLSGEGNLARMGYGAASNLGEDLASALMSQSQLAYAGATNQNEAQQGALGGIGGLLAGGLGDLGLGGVI